MKPASDIPVDCFRQIMIWPLQVYRQNSLSGIEFDEVTQLLEKCGWAWADKGRSAQATNLKDLPWYTNPIPQKLEGSPPKPVSAEHEYDYSEIVYFHSYVRDFLYGGDGKRAGERTLRVFRRSDIHSMCIDLDHYRKYKLRVNRLEAYLFRTGVLLIVADVATPAPVGHDLKFSLKDALDLQNVMRMVFPRRWNSVGKPSEAPLRVAWLDSEGKLITESEQDYAQKSDFTNIVREQAELPVAKHWQYLLKKIPFYGAHKADNYSIKQIEDQRIPSMTYLAVPDPREISEWDFARIAFFDSAGHSSVGSYSDEFLKGWEKESAYDRFWQRELSSGKGEGVDEHNDAMRTRWLCSGYGFAAVGASSDAFYRGQIAANFGHHYFRMGLIAHFQRASLLTFRDQLAEATERIGVNFRKEVMEIQSNVTKFRARFWFHEVSTQLQGQEIFAWWSDRLGNQKMFDRVTADIEAAESQVRTQIESEEASYVSIITNVGAIFAVVGLLAALSSLVISIDGSKWQEQLTSRIYVFESVMLLALIVAAIMWGAWGVCWSIFTRMKRSL